MVNLGGFLLVSVSLVSGVVSDWESWANWRGQFECGFVEQDLGPDSDFLIHVCVCVLLKPEGSQ